MTEHEGDRLPTAESAGFPLRMLKTKKGDQKREKCTRFNEDTILVYGNDEVIDSPKLAL